MANESFDEVLNDLDGGETVAELTRQLKSVVAAVKQTRLSGALTLRLVVKPGQRSDAVQVHPQIAPKIPTRATDAQIYFATDDGELSRSNPKQQELVGLDAPRPKLVDINDGKKKAQ